MGGEKGEGGWKEGMEVEEEMLNRIRYRRKRRPRAVWGGGGISNTSTFIHLFINRGIES